MSASLSQINYTRLYSSARSTPGSVGLRSRPRRSGGSPASFGLLGESRSLMAIYRRHSLS